MVHALCLILFLFIHTYLDVLWLAREELRQPQPQPQGSVNDEASGVNEIHTLSSNMTLMLNVFPYFSVYLNQSFAR